MKYTSKKLGIIVKTCNFAPQKFIETCFPR